MSYGADKLKRSKHLIFKLNLTLKVKIDHPQNNRHLNQGLLHLCSKFGDSSLNELRLIVRTSPWLIHTHGHTDTQMQATTIPEGQNWPRVTIRIHQTYIFRSRYAIILKIARLTIYNRDWKKHNKICTVGKIGHVILVAVTGTIKLVSYLKSSHCISFEDLEPVDLSSHKVAETAWQYARMVAQ